MAKHLIDIRIVHKMLKKRDDSKAEVHTLFDCVNTCQYEAEAFFLILFHEFIGIAATVTDCPVMNFRHKSVKIEESFF